jgi:hypothetical protein
MGDAAVHADGTSDAHAPLVAEVARGWVEELAARLTSSGRRLEGGWPGTISEARNLLTRRLAVGKVVLDRTDRERMARAVYDSARSSWLAMAERCPAVPHE